MSSVNIFSEHVQNALKRIVKDFPIANTSIEIKNGSKVGDGFQGELIGVTIKGVLLNDIHSTNTEIELNLLCKLPPTNENRRKEFKSDNVFEREIYFYTKVLPTFIDFQREKLIPEKDQFLAYPKCYAGLGLDGECDFAIIMEDLRPKGFQMWNKAKPTTPGNIHLVLEQIAKFHAISFAMKDQKSDEFAEFKKLTDIMVDFVESSTIQGMFVNSFERAKNVLYADHHKKIMSNLQTNYVNYSGSSLSEFAVISHGDLWNNNIMYRFNQNNFVDDIKFIDWQLMRYASPALDLVYHIFTATDKTLRDYEYMNLLRHYHNSLTQMIKGLGSDPDKLFTFQNLLDEMKEYGNYGFLMTPMVLSVSLADSSQITNLDEMCDEIASGKVCQELITELSDNAEIEYKIRINDTIGDLVILGYYKPLN